MTRTLRIGTFNLENLGQRRGEGPVLAERLAALRPALQRLGADVLCLQEVNGQPGPAKGPRHLQALDQLLAGTAYAGYQRCHTRGAGGHGVRDVHNLVILSRLPILSSRELLNELVPPPTVALPAQAGESPVPWDRPILQATLGLEDGRRLEVVNLHYRAPLAAALQGQKAGAFSWKSTAGWAQGYFLAALKRTGQALETRLLVDQLFDAEAEALICVAGDFNATLEEMPLRIVMAREEDTGNGHLAGRALTALERSLPESIRFTVLHHGRAQALDHLLVSRALSAGYRHVEIHNEGLADEVVGYSGIAQSAASFHAPVVAEFDLG